MFDINAAASRKANEVKEIPLIPSGTWKAEILDAAFDKEPISNGKFHLFKIKLGKLMPGVDVSHKDLESFGDISNARHEVPVFFNAEEENDSAANIMAENRVKAMLLIANGLEDSELSLTDLGSSAKGRVVEFSIAHNKDKNDVTRANTSGLALVA